MVSTEKRPFSPKETIGRAIVFGTFIGIGFALGANSVNKPDIVVGAALIGFGLGGVGYIGKEGWRPFLDRLHRNFFRD